MCLVFNWTYLALDPSLPAVKLFPLIAFCVAAISIFIGFPSRGTPSYCFMAAMAKS